MVSFRNIITAAAATAAFAVPALAAITPAGLVSNLQTLAKKSQALQSTANEITAVNGLQLAISEGPYPKIINGFRDIINVTTTDIQRLRGTAPIRDNSDIHAIYVAYREFGRVHRALLDTLTEKADLFYTVPIIGGAVSNVLEDDQKTLDSFYNNLNDVVRGRVRDFQNQARSIDDTLEVAVDAYKGLQLTKRDSAGPISRVKRAMIAAV